MKAWVPFLLILCVSAIHPQPSFLSLVVGTVIWILAGILLLIQKENIKITNSFFIKFNMMKNFLWLHIPCLLMIFTPGLVTRNFYATLLAFLYTYLLMKQKLLFPSGNSARIFLILGIELGIMYWIY